MVQTVKNLPASSGDMGSIPSQEDPTCCCCCAAKSLQSCPTLCDTIDSSPPGSPVPGILQARTLEWVAISFSNAWKWKVKVKSLSRAWLLATPWTAASQAPPSMGFSRQEHWSGVPLPSPTRWTATKSCTTTTEVYVPYSLCSQQERPPQWEAWELELEKALLQQQRPRII